MVPAVGGGNGSSCGGSDGSRDHVLVSLAVIPLLKGSGNIPACSS